MFADCFTTDAWSYDRKKKGETLKPDRECSTCLTGQVL